MELEYTTFSIVEQLSRVISTQENQAILKDIETVSYTHLDVYKRQENICHNTLVKTN